MLGNEPTTCALSNIKIIKAAMSNYNKDTPLILLQFPSIPLFQGRFDTFQHH